MLNDWVRRVTGKPAPRLLDDTLTAFLACYDNCVTRRTYERILRPFAQTIGPQSALASITPEEMDAWAQQQHTYALAPATLANRTKAVKTFWNWCVKREYIAPSPARFLVVKRSKKTMVSKAIPSDILLAMFEAAQHKRCTFLSARDSAILALLITFGARAGDVTRLKMSHIDLKNQQIVFVVKGGGELLLPLPPHTRQHMTHWLTLRQKLEPNPAHDYVFVNIRTRPGMRYAPLAPGSVSTLISRLSARVCGYAYRPHAIRHWRGQTLADQRVAPTIVQTILGHSDVRTTLEHYYNQDRVRVRRILDTYELGHGLVPPEHINK
jgi:integrase/recombinase XerC